MNEQTEKLIRELADKLGTTVEHLWGVLIKQAPITAVTDLLECVMLAVVCIVGGKYLLRWHRKLDGNCEADHPGLVMLYVVWVVMLIITIISVLTSVSEIANAILNPEYWALKQITGK